jgi:hypothetical protein
MEIRGLTDRAVRVTSHRDSERSALSRYPPERAAKRSSRASFEATRNAQQIAGRAGRRRPASTTTT